MGAIMPALMNRIPSELRSEAFFDESSTRMDDLLGSPHLAPLFRCFFLFLKAPMFLVSFTASVG